MKIFNFPKTTKFGKVIPKKYFDNFTNTKQKKGISTLIQRIRWQYKLATSTTNLPSKKITEIQVFVIELKIKDDLKSILEIIDRAIPYPIIFVLIYDEEVLFSTSIKHNHPNKPDKTVIDCTFKTNWIEIAKNSIQPVLHQSLDWTYMNFCNQISGRKQDYKSYSAFVAKMLEIKTLESSIIHIEKQIGREIQFNKKVALNMQLIELKKELKQL